MITRDGAKMSKSKGNTVSPAEYVARYGADAARTYVCFMGPPERGGDWSDEGVEGVFRFLSRLWRAGHEVAARQMRRFGGMVSFRLRRGEDAAVKACAAVSLWTLGESLGGVESLIEHPGRMTHASVVGTALEVPGDLIRLSVGIEDVEDLIDDLREALDIHG